MVGMVKKTLIIIIQLMCVFITSCTIEYHYDIDKKAKTWIQYFKNEDVDGLFKLFCSDIKDNYSDKTLDEIRMAFEFIDGDIVEYKYKGEGGGGQTKDNYKTILYYCYPEYLIETSTGKKYNIIFSYKYIWKAKPECEGIGSIRVINYEGDRVYSGKEVNIGIDYDIHE